MNTADVIDSEGVVPKSPDTPPVTLATKCTHTTASVKARGLCAACYRAWQKAQNAARAVAAAPRNNEDATIAPVADLANDPAAKSEFFRIMWSWLRTSEIEPIYKGSGKDRVRDYEIEIALMKLNETKYAKAATVLGKGYVVEKREEIKPVPLPFGGEFDDTDWEDDPMPDAPVAPTE